MDFSLSEEQTLLQDSVRRFVTESFPPDRPRGQPGGKTGFPGEHWAIAAELGWLGLLVSEDGGGLGGTAEDGAVLMEEFGRGLVPLPYISAAALTATMLDGAPDFAGKPELLERIVAGETLVALASEEPASRYDPLAVQTRAKTGAGGEVTLTGRKIMVLDGGAAESFIVTARMEETGELALVLVPGEAPGLSRRQYPTIDGREAADLEIENVRAPASAAICAGDAATDLLAVAIDRASVLMAAEALGAMQAVTAMTEEYMKTRKQFGQPLSSFQVLSHRLADMFVQVENTRSMLYRALAQLGGRADQRAAAVSATMVAVSRAGEFIGGQAIQLHGGIGMAEESPVGHYYKRLRVIARTFGDERWHIRRYIRLTDAQDDREAS